MSMRISYGAATARVAALFLVLACMTSCATNEQVTKLENRLRSLEARSARQDSTVMALNTAQKSGQNAKQSDIAAMKNRIDNLEREIEQLTNTIADLEQRLSSSSRGGVGTVNKLNDKSDSDPTAKQSGVDCVKLYDDSFIQMRQENYESAVAGFRDYLKYCSGSDYADNAQYWIGEAYFSQRKFTDAEAEFKTLISDYPSADNIATAMYKLARCYEEAGDKTAARKQYQQVVDKYPKSSEAQLALDKIKELK